MARLLHSQKSNKKTPAKKETLYKDAKQNAEEIKRLFSHGTNEDFISRELIAAFNKKKVYLFFYSSIVNSNSIEEFVIKPLLEEEGESVSDVITNKDITQISDYQQAIENINNGKVIIFIDGDDNGYGMEVSQFQHRAIGKAENESVIKGPKEAFTESLYVNMSLVRKQIRDKQLITELTSIGERAKQSVILVYVDDLVNDEVLENVKNRIKNIEIDTVRNVELLEQLIEERPNSIFPSILYTERPDNAAAYLENGYIVILMDNSAACLILPVTFWDFFHNPEDRYTRYIFGNLTRLIRFLGLFLTTMISAIYVALANFHSEMIPPDLLLAITAARERVPFPLIMEILIMEIAFELIREAGIRIPNPLGPTIGIVGALILGQAAVEANVISPIIVIVAAISGLSSFAISDVSLNYSVRISRFIFILAAGFMGMFSLIGVFLLLFMYAASLKSFGIPFFAPVAPNYKSQGDTLFRKVLRAEIWRPTYVTQKDIQKKKKN
ncbi:spore germination protein [Paraliobacillus quinghaiensis]|uniref:Spore germination protein n=1 Tax=Paraliobacillus quinghaiensis TaxID=470815 RepID=A0A917TXM0_9BACI|nr:spore germination protein [Paraliobacillus quinghaiensis]GGM43125.1 spore germination protein [Paraliobacillus quinghaiensis]